MKTWIAIGIEAAERREGRRQPSDDSGATLVEYALLLALISVVVAVALPMLGVRLGTAFCPVITMFGGTCP